MVQIASTIVGFSRLGPNRELKKLVETYWSSAIKDEAALVASVNDLQLARFDDLSKLGLALIPSGDFSLYDQVLDAAFTFNLIPQRHRAVDAKPSLRTYFAMARGLQEPAQGVDVSALPMKKWFDTNYHYIVPEFDASADLAIVSSKFVDDFTLVHARRGVATRPTIIGPLTLLSLTKFAGAAEGLARLSLLDKLVGLYEQLLVSLVDAGAQWIQLDEPVLTSPLSANEPEWRAALAAVYTKLQAAVAAAPAKAQAKLTIATYFAEINAPELVVPLVPKGVFLHIDLVRAAHQLPAVLKHLPEGVNLSLGLVNGRNVWKGDLGAAHALLTHALAALGNDTSRVIVSSSCSLLHTPYSLRTESAEVRAQPVFDWLAFGLEKVAEVVAIANHDTAAFDAHKASLAARAASPLTRSDEVRARVAQARQDIAALYRQEAYEQRVVEQKAALPFTKVLFPTTTIGSFPQSAEVRSQRARFRSGRVTAEAYDAYIKEATAKCIQLQEDLDLDVLVHGEFERTDMVEFFAETLNGFLITTNGWVQSYGSRGVKPAILYGDVSRSVPMTVDLAKYAQSLTSRPVKGMLTGPTTILQWTFVRDDIPYPGSDETLLQVALALRDEVSDLEQVAGLQVIQVDEPGFREGLPLRQADWQNYLDNAVKAFRVSTGSVKATTQIHTHMCYSEFGSILKEVARLDADVLSIECSRADLELVSAFATVGYPLQIGPGLYDIHSPRVPSVEEIAARLRQLAEILPVERLHANPDCGLKTRGWPETEAALAALVQATKTVRAELAQ